MAINRPQSTITPLETSHIEISPRDFNLPSKFTHYRQDTHLNQAAIILDLLSAQERFLLLSAPPGVGKSPINISVASGLQARTLYLTANKSLQTQLAEFSEPPTHLFDIRGHSNYPCASFSFDHDDELADFECEARSGGVCYYRQDIEKLLPLQLVSTNYHNWIHLHLCDDPNRLGSFDLIICDEAHNLLDLLTEKASIILNSNMIARNLVECLPRGVPKLDTILAYSSWANDVLPSIDARIKTRRHNGASKKELLALAKLQRTFTRLSSEPLTNPDDWLLTATKRYDVKLVPLDISRYAEEYIFRGSSKVLLTSATITRDDAKDLGIAATDLHYLEVDSPFPVERRPIYYFPTNPPAKIDSRATEMSKRLWTNQIIHIIMNHLNSKGIIHARSYERAAYIHSKLIAFEGIRELISRGELSIFIHDKQNFASVVSEFKSSSVPAVLISPSIEEGYDFPQDLCRWQVIAKVPFLDLRDEITAARKARDKSYPDRMTARSIIQSAGRGMRSEDDFCETFIIDAHWSYFQRKIELFPAWFRKAFKRIDAIPKETK